MILYVTYDERKNYPEFFYNFSRFNVASLDSDSLLMVSLSNDHKSSWTLRFIKN